MVGRFAEATIAMDCQWCGGKLERGTVPFTLDRSGYHVSWDAVPAWVCGQCGELLFEEREVDLMQEALVALDRQTAALTAAGSPDSSA
jgi:YgiT-type zinc finger domain-containing protein